MARAPSKGAVIDAETRVLDTRAMGGGLEGAQRTERETVTWQPVVMSADRMVNPEKEMADGRSRDMMLNDGYVNGAVATHKDSIVGAEYRLNARPNWKLLGASEAWAEEFQEITEARFNLLADSTENWFDAERKKTLTDLIRLGIGSFCTTGEIVGAVEWIREQRRPFNTAIQMVSPSRLSNPDGMADDKFLRRGIRHDLNGKPVTAYIRYAHPGDWWDSVGLYKWREVPFEKPWGRRQMIHIIEPMQTGQTRGISEMVSVLKQMRSTKKFQDVTLQNAVVNASYAAAIESELPSEMVYRAMGAGSQGLNPVMGEFMTALAAYTSNSGNIQIDGVKIPHLFPGTKLNLKPMGTPGGVGTEFEQSLLRHIAAALGLSYEQFSRDYTKTNYSSARASMAETWKFMQSRKKIVADKLATMIYQLWLEEELNAGNLPLPPGGAAAFYDPVKREALAACTWIGASRGQIDEKKETESAIMRIKAGLSTYEEECARLGNDFRRIFEQRAREEKLMVKLGLSFSAPNDKANATEVPSANNTEAVE